ncbi:chorismate--pyruvate lyase [Pandoraea terrae]|uniref:Probable chorismate pyruvate-lyase n=1 Tax=Pandoraea terrae TaxID=1537710 RepID=A0A5E4VR70_9BURK|nr:chorismate lyase [Pandoraea terrae]VVE13505.1 chorismate--pyruvate lyase [Pandoraea terrae]
MTSRFDVAGHRWQRNPAPALSRHQKDWLTRGGSLTRHLKTLGHVTLDVLAERVVPADPDQHACLGVPPRTPLWARDVLQSIDGVPMVVAHSVTPLRFSRSTWQAMRRLKTRPLADLLYFDRAVSRSILVSRALAPAHLLHRAARQQGHDPHLRARLWARRSVFLRHGAPLLVTEAFLPRFWRRLAQADGEATQALSTPQTA